MQHFLSLDINQSEKETAKERERERGTVCGDTCRTAYVANVDTEGCTAKGRQTHLDLVYEVGLIQQINAHGHNPRGSTQAIHVAVAGLILCVSSLKFLCLVLRMRRVGPQSCQHFCWPERETEKEADTN